jgi:hypothetical protein
VRVSVVRGGGFAGLVRTVSADTDQLAPGDGRELEALVRRAGLLDAPPAPGSGEPRPDQFTFTVTVEDQGHRRTSAFSERSLPREVRDLVSWVSTVSGHEERIEPPGGARR